MHPLVKSVLYIYTMGMIRERLPKRITERPSSPEVTIEVNHLVLDIVERSLAMPSVPEVPPPVPVSKGMRTRTVEKIIPGLDDTYRIEVVLAVPDPSTDVYDARTATSVFLSATNKDGEIESVLHFSRQSDEQHPTPEEKRNSPMRHGDTLIEEENVPSDFTESTDWSITRSQQTLTGLMVKQMATLPKVRLQERRLSWRKLHELKEEADIFTKIVEGKYKENDLLFKSFVTILDIKKDRSTAAAIVAFTGLTAALVGLGSLTYQAPVTENDSRSAKELLVVDYAGIYTSFDRFDTDI